MKLRCACFVFLFHSVFTSACSAVRTIAAFISCTSFSFSFGSPLATFPSFVCCSR